MITAYKMPTRAILCCICIVLALLTTISGAKKCYMNIRSNCPEKGLPTLIDSNNSQLCSQYLSITSNQQAQLEMLTRKVMELEELLNSILSTTEKPPPVVPDLTTSYVRWGRTECPSTSQLLYQGVAAKSYYSHVGGGANYLCLPMDPEWPENVIAGTQDNSLIYGVEYEDRVRNKDLNNHDVPCAVCEVNGRGHVRMIPAKTTCPIGWTKEYNGTLVAERITHTKSTYECLDEAPEIRIGGAEDKNGGIFCAVAGQCGSSLPCPPYVEGYELSCVVCTK